MATFTDQIATQPFKLQPPSAGPAGVMGPGIGGLNNTHLRIRSVANKSKAQGQQQRTAGMQMMAPGGMAQQQPQGSTPMQPQRYVPPTPRPQGAGNVGAMTVAGSLLVKHRGLIDRFIDRVLVGG